MQNKPDNSRVVSDLWESRSPCIRLLPLHGFCLSRQTSTCQACFHGNSFTCSPSKWVLANCREFNWSSYTQSWRSFNPKSDCDSDQVSIGNGQAIPITHIGNGWLKTHYRNFKLRNVLRVSQISSNLFVHRLFSDNNCWCWCWCSQFFNSGHTYGQGALQTKSEQGLYPIHTALASICQIVN